MPHSTIEKRRAYLSAKREAESPEQREERLAHRRVITKKSDDKNRSSRRVYSKAYYGKNAKQRSDYQKANLPRINAQRKARRERDANYRIRCNLGTRIRIAVRKCKTNKCAKTSILLGCDVALFRLHLQAQFKPGMAWDNYGTWHVDHIIPCAEFDLRQPEQQRACFHYSNLQPLWGVDNLRKGRKLTAAS